MKEFELIKNPALQELPSRVKREEVSLIQKIDEIYVQESKSKIEEEGAVKSGNYVNHVTARETLISGGERVAEIRSPEAESYSGLVEERHNFPIRQALDSAEPRIISVLDTIDL